MKAHTEVLALIKRHGARGQSAALDYLAEIHDGSAGLFNSEAGLIVGRGVPADGWQFVLDNIAHLMNGTEEISEGSHSAITLRYQGQFLAVFYSRVPWMDAALATEIAGHILGGAELDKRARGRFEIRKEQLVWVLDRNEWNLARTARTLGIARGTLYARMREYGIG